MFLSIALAQMGDNMGEFLEMRIYDRDLQVSDSEMHMMLEKAAL